MGSCRKGNWGQLGIIEMRMRQSKCFGYRFFAPIILLTLIILPVQTNAAIHFGTGIGFYDGEYIYYNDKGYYKEFSVALGVYSNFDTSHMVTLDIHFYTKLSEPMYGVSPILYGGLGGIFTKGIYSGTHENDLNWSKRKWGVRSPVGIEFMTASGISMFAEIAPTYIPSLKNKYETSNAFGIRYYFY